MKRSLRQFTMIGLGMIATSGFWGGTKGLALPHFIADLGVSPAMGATIFSATAIGWSLTSFLFGGISQRFGLKKPAQAGWVVTLCTLTILFTARQPVPLYVASAAIGTGLSLVEMCTSLPVSLLYEGDRQSGMLNLLHGFYGVGNLVGVAWAGYWLAAGAGWRVAMGLAGVGVTLCALSFSALPALPVPRHQREEGGGYGPLIGDPLVWAAALALSAAVAVEIGMELFLPTFLLQAKGVSETTAALYTSLFYVGFTGTRLAGSLFVQRFGAVRSVIAMGLVGMAGLLGLILLPGSFGWLSPLAGLGIAISFPTCVGLVANRYPSRVGRVYSLMYSSGGVAGIVVGPLMGWVAQQAGLTAAFLMLLAGDAILLLSIGYYGSRDRS